MYSLRDLFSNSTITKTSRRSFESKKRRLSEAVNTQQTVKIVSISKDANLNLYNCVQRKTSKRLNVRYVWIGLKKV